MRRRKDIEMEIDAVLGSMDDSQRATPGDYFYTRLQARMLTRPAGIWERAVGFMARPSVAITCIAVVLLVNAVTMAKQWYTTPVKVEQASLQAFADEYNLGVVTFYDDDKIEP